MRLYLQEAALSVESRLSVCSSLLCVLVTKTPKIARTKRHRTLKVGTRTQVVYTTVTACTIWRWKGQKL